jgi:hypothetical protein
MTLIYFMIKNVLFELFKMSNNRKKIYNNVNVVVTVYHLISHYPLQYIRILHYNHTLKMILKILRPGINTCASSVLAPLLLVVLTIK